VDDPTVYDSTGGVPPPARRASRPGNGSILGAGCLVLTLIFIPLVGHVILTVMILDDDLTLAEKLLWLVVVWFVWFLGPFLYLLFGQRKNRLLGARA
jgi:Phospholipase_D-nuclease N-terminal